AVFDTLDVGLIHAVAVNGAAPLIWKIGLLASTCTTTFWPLPKRSAPPILPFGSHVAPPVSEPSLACPEASNAIVPEVSSKGHHAPSDGASDAAPSPPAPTPSNPIRPHPASTAQTSMLRDPPIELDDIRPRPDTIVT